MKIKLLSENARVPVKEPGNAGYDLFAAERVVVPPLERRLIKTDISLEIPRGFYGRIADRSGMSYKRGGTVLAGVLDETFRGNIGVILHNVDKEKEIVIEIGDRPAQLIFERYYDFSFVVVNELSETKRGINGWGSSGN